MRNAVLAIVVVLIGIPATAQEAGDTIFVTERNGVETKGRFLRLSPVGLALLVDGQERTIPSTSVGRIERRDSLWDGMLIGAVPGAMIGLMGARGSCSSPCVSDVLLTGAIGAGIGALIDFGSHGYSRISGPSVASSNAPGDAAPVTSLDALWQRVREGDRIEVTTRSGQKTTGRFVQTSPTSVTIMVRGDRREIRSSDVRLVTRAGNHYRIGALRGAMTGGMIGFLGGTTCGDSSECDGAAIVLGTVGASVGALWGTVIGAVIPRHPAVYRAGSFSSVRVSPMLHPGRVGVAVTRSF